MLHRIKMFVLCWAGWVGATLLFGGSVRSALVGAGFAAGVALLPSESSTGSEGP